MKQRYAGTPVKNVGAAFMAPDGSVIKQEGEFLVTEHGVEGNLVYALSAPLRDTIETAGSATLDELGNQRDLSWIIAESPAQTPELPIPAASPGEDITVLSLVTWRGGHRVVRRLATTHPHGFWVHWEHRGTTRQR